MTDEEEEIAAIAHRLRRCIESIEQGRLPLSMENFPRGACGDSALLLGAFLSDFGHIGFKYVCGERGSAGSNTWTTHAWLQRGTVIVDITADQFEDAPEAVIVNRCSAWHATFRVEQTPSPADFRVWSGPGADQLHLVYAQLRDAMLSIAN